MKNKVSMILHAKIVHINLQPIALHVERDRERKKKKTMRGKKLMRFAYVKANTLRLRRGVKRNSNVLKIPTNDSFVLLKYFCFQFSQSRNHVSSYVFQTLQFSACSESNTRQIYYNETVRLFFRFQNKKNINKQIIRNSIPIEVNACLLMILYLC